MAALWCRKLSIADVHFTLLSFVPSLSCIDCILLTPRAPVSQASVFCLALYLHLLVLACIGCALLTPVYNNETCSAAAALGINCIPKHDGCLHF